jgi:hypothetical protein
MINPELPGLLVREWPEQAQELAEMQKVLDI